MSDSAQAAHEGRAKRVFSIAKTSVQRLADGGTDRAAAMAYYAIQSLFPGLLVVVLLSLLLSSPETITDVIKWGKEQGLDPGLANSLEDTLRSSAEKTGGGAFGIATVVAAVTSISSASGWLAAAGRAIEPDSDRRRSRNPITGRLRFGAWTGVLLVLLVVALTLLTLGGSVADTVFGWLGVSDGAPLVWEILRPILVVGGIVIAMLVLFRVAPDRIHSPSLRHLLPGAIVAGLGWVLASGAFLFYINNLASIGATYGAFATPIILLLWLWLSGVVVLLGNEVNAELTRRRDGIPHPHQLPGADDPAIAGHPAGVVVEAPEPDGD